IDSRMLGELPFTPAFSGALVLRAADLGLNMHPSGRAFVFPQVGGFVGGDTVAGIVATRLERMPDPSMLVDIGTNGEIVLSHAGRLLATSVAAGPAFEGARISCGMRAVAGAVEKAVIADDLRLNVIADSAPAGLCGSGLIDLAAELLRVGVIDETGRILPPEEWPADTPPALRRRWRASGEGGDFVLAFADEAAAGVDLLFTQRDVRELQLASAAVRAGINILLKMHDLSPADLQTVLLAGGFGNFIRRNHARRIGLLPPVPCERIRFVGNTSAMGARMALLSRRERSYAAEVCGRVEHVDLSLSADFQLEFSTAMIFPARGDWPDQPAEGVSK
ncbi:MAG: ASKHA domain-containing protein, partial [Kiritimatiellia bacterium]